MLLVLECKGLAFGFGSKCHGMRYSVFGELSKMWGLPCCVLTVIDRVQWGFIEFHYGLLYGGCSERMAF